MSKHFIEQRTGSSSIQTARQQQRRLSYFTQSKVQEDITISYLEAWANRNYRGEDAFLNWVRTVFRIDNFLSFFKYLRFPLASARLINDRIKTPLSRVFFSEDSFFNYFIKGENVSAPDNLNVKSFNDEIFNALLFRYNDILIHDLRDINDPIRHLVSIDNVVALESHNSVISRIAYTATIVIEDKEITGFLFLDAFNYAFFEKDKEHPTVVIPHDLGVCPADYISKESFSDDDIVRKSIFSYAREELEEYVFLKTLQRMTDPNGALPIMTMLDTSVKNTHDDIKGSSEKEPMSPREMGGQKATIGKELDSSKSIMQTGSQIKIPMIKKTSDGSVDTDLITNFVKFHRAPVDSLEYMNTRIKDIEKSIVVSLCGDFSESDESAKNRLQVFKGFTSKEDKLREVSVQMSRIRNNSDWKMLALQFGKENISVDCFYGSDFFLESQDELYKLFKESPNPIERRTILNRIAKNRSRFNPDRAEREVLLNKLLPYSSDADFDKAIGRNVVDTVLFELQTRFDHWIDIFQANFGDMLEFWNMIEGTESEKLVLINNLIKELINQSVTTVTVTTE